MKKIAIGSKGNIFTGLSAIFILSFIIIFILLLNVNTSILNENNLESDNIKYIVEDYNRNIEILANDSLKEVSENVYKTNIPLKDSEDEIKKILNEKLSKLNEEFKNKYAVNIQSEVIIVENHEKPEFLKIKTILTITKSNEKYNGLVESKASVLNLKDPLPILLCGKLDYNESKLFYGDSLTNYLKNRNVENPENYINASSPLIIKKCPYDPYIHHGDNQTLFNCIQNGYYHESADGSCYLCRLEGKGLCPHYGFETFIIPSKDLKTNLSSTSASDHVIFMDNYPGKPYYYYDNRIIFLDDSHRAKYGL